ncbi:MAG: hypothetical protein ABJA81_01470 [Nocardioidaceae bacterium]
MLRIIGDIAAGAQSMGEHDFLAECRRRGLPAPSHQVRRRLPSGKVYLEVYWDAFGVVVEIEGAQHLVAGLAVADSLRQNELTISHDRVLRVPVLGLHVAKDEFFDQIARLLRTQGWRPPPPCVLPGDRGGSPPPRYVLLADRRGCRRARRKRWGTAVAIRVVHRRAQQRAQPIGLASRCW